MAKIKTGTKMPQNQSEAAGTRNLGDKRCVRFSISIQNEYDRKLGRLSTSCQMSKSKMADALLRIALDSPELIEWFQKTYNKDEQYLVNPVVINNKLYY
ncbi:hypothetical protein R3O67_33385 [Bacillus cereus]|uniref:hypothetical protein n=1 Tax=Bacillus cereus TaxID=1396 RepID=UPI00307ACAEE